MLLTIQFVDHPLIALAQAVAGVAFLRLFLLVRCDPAPVPQIMLGMAVAIFCNLAARVTDASWFYIVDIFQYSVLAALVISAIYQRIHRNKEASRVKGAAVHIPDFFDRQSVRLTWVAGILAVGLLLVGYIKTWQDKQEVIVESGAKETQAAVTAATTVTREFQQQQAQADAKAQRRDDSLNAVLSTLAANDTVIIGNQYTVMGQNAHLSKKVDEKSALTRKVVREGLSKLPMQTLPPPAPHADEDEKSTPKKSLYEKFKNWIHVRNAAGDPVDLGRNYSAENIVPPDTSLRY